METSDMLIGLILGILSGGGIVSVWFKSKLDELNATKERLNIERRKVYSDLLAPYIKTLAATNRGENTEEISNHIRSDQYRQSAFEFTLLGSDEVVKAYTDLMLYFYRAEESGKQNTEEMLRLWGKLRLEIRKDLGNKDTKLKGIDLLKPEIKDLYKLDISDE